MARVPINTSFPLAKASCEKRENPLQVYANVAARPWVNLQGVWWETLLRESGQRHRGAKVGTVFQPRLSGPDAQGFTHMQGPLSCPLVSLESLKP